MYYFIEEMSRQREQELAARTRSGLFAHTEAVRRGRAVQRRGERGHVHLPSFAYGAWRRWASRDEVRCTRAAAVTGTC